MWEEDVMLPSSARYPGSMPTRLNSPPLLGKEKADLAVGWE